VANLLVVTTGLFLILAIWLRLQLSEVQLLRLESAPRSTGIGFVVSPKQSLGAKVVSHLGIRQIVTWLLIGVLSVGVFLGLVYLLIRVLGWQATLVIIGYFLYLLWQEIQEVLAEIISASGTLQEANAGRKLLRSFLKKSFNVLESTLSPKNIKRFLYRYTGELILPRRVCRNDSKDISMRLKLSSMKEAVGEASKIDLNKSGDFRGLSFETDNNSGQYLEAELGVPTSIEIHGENPKQLSLDNQELVYCWACDFYRPGNYNILLTIRLLNTPTQSYTLGEIPYRISVGRFTEEQVKLLKTTCEIVTWISGVLTIVDVIHNLQS
jgi:hypothetical protein